jgi:hypothetical protein
MSKKGSKDEPLLERFSKMLDRKQQRMLKLQHDVNEKKMIDDPDAFNPPFRPKINEFSCKIVDEKRKHRDMSFLESLNVWKQIKEDKKKLRQIAKQIEDGAECTFQPDLKRKKETNFGQRSHSIDVTLTTLEDKTNG